MIVRFVDIGGIVDNHCPHFFFIIVFSTFRPVYEACIVTKRNSNHCSFNFFQVCNGDMPCYMPYHIERQKILRFDGGGGGGGGM